MKEEWWSPFFSKTSAAAAKNFSHIRAVLDLMKTPLDSLAASLISGAVVPSDGKDSFKDMEYRKVVHSTLVP